jgi:hypothetical protein
MRENINRELADIISIVFAFAPYFPLGGGVGMGMGDPVLRIADERVNRKRKCWGLKGKPA